MPLPGGPAIPQDLLDAAEGQDDIIGESFAEIIPMPDKPYSAKVFNALLTALSAATEVMGIMTPFEPADGPVDGFGQDEARVLAMLDAASREYGSPFPVALDAIMGDSELTLITAHLMQLAKDEGFAAFLDSEAPEDEVLIEEEVEPAGDFDFGSRMSTR